jgi:RNA polymerase sigma-70 factor (ECF subfamily)
MHALAQCDNGSVFAWKQPAFEPGRAPLNAAGESGVGGLSALIVAIAERGDRQAFGTLFGHFAPRVKSYLLRLGASAEAAEELAQETLLIVWRRAGGFDPSRAAASTWIFTIARNLRFDALRREKRPTVADDPSDAAGGPAAPDTILAALQDETRIGRAVAELPADQARVVRLAFFADKPHSEIAAELDLPLGTVKSRLRLAMGRLRALLGEAT